MSNAENAGADCIEYEGYVVRSGPDLYSVMIHTKNDEPIPCRISVDTWPEQLAIKAQMNSDLFEGLALKRPGAGFIYYQNMRGEVGKVIPDIFEEPPKETATLPVSLDSAQ